MSRRKYIIDLFGILTAALVPFGGGASTAAAGSPTSVNPYPETREEIDAYKEHLIRRHHEEICDYPEEVTEISTLRELSEYAGKSRVHVKMEPGTYAVTPHNYEEFLEEEVLFDFSGTDSYFDLRGVELRVDSLIAPITVGQGLREVSVSGSNLIIEGLTVTNTGDHAPIPREYAVNVSAGGENNLLKGLVINSRGTYPYGYGCYLTMVHHWNAPIVPKRRALGAGGQNNVFMDIEVYNRGNGHAVGWTGSTNQTFIDCYVEGEVRLMDDIFRELSEPGYGPRFEADFDDIEEKIKTLPDHLSRGRMTSLGEDAFRSYGGEGGNVKVLGGTVKNVRNVFIRGNYDTSFISNVRVLRKWGFHTNHAEKTRIVNSETDLLFGQFLVIYGGEGREVDLTVVPADPDFLPVEVGHRGRSALIGGSEHNIVLRSGGELGIDNPPPISVTGRDIDLRNETGLPIELTEDSRNNRIITNGKVTDQGKDNKIEYFDGG